MTATILRQPLAVLLLISCTSIIAQQTATFNQNASRSNHVQLKTFNQNASRSNHTRLSFYVSPVYSTPVGNKNDSLLFRGSGTGVRFGADYFLGKVSIGITSGFTNSSTDNTVINNFLKRTAIPQDQLQITKSKQQNMYVLLGPSIQFGNAVQLHAHAKAGLFINNAGTVTLQQRGAQRAAYRNESTDKNMFPGFLTGLSIQYTLGSSPWSIGLGADYMNTKTEVNNFDARRGGGVEGLKLSRNISDVMAGVTIRYTVRSPRDAASGQASGRRSFAANDPDAAKGVVSPRDAASGRPTGRRMHSIKSPRDLASGQSTGKRISSPRDAASGRPTGKRISSPSDVASGMPTGKRMSSPRDAASGLPTGKRMSAPRDAASGLATGKRSFSPDEPSCGPVTRKVTNPDGTSEEMTFSCPADAAAWENSNADDHNSSRSRFSTISNASKAKHTIAGTLTWSASGTSMGITTNKSNPARSGSATLNSQSSSTRTTNQSSFGTMVRIMARETGSGRPTGRRNAPRDAASGLATGKRSSRDASSGLATGRRQHSPVFFEGEGGVVCNPCAASVVVNPLYQGNGNAGENPMHKDNARTISTTSCDGVADVDVYLIELNTDNVIAKTRTETCGDFFFTDVPDGEYIVRVSGYWLSKKGYDITVNSKSDLLGDISDADDWMELSLESGNNDNMQQKAGISTSRSNIRTKNATMDVTVTDTDGDGIEVRLAKSPNDAPLFTSWTDENDEFEFNGIEPGTYFMSFDQEIYIEDETVVSTGMETIVTSEDNLEDPPGMTKVTPAALTSRSTASQSFKTIIVEADLDGDGTYESNVTSQVSDEFSTNANGEMQQKAGISTSRSNLRQKSGLQQISSDLYTCTATATLNNKDTPVRAILKTKHDTVKNSINNIR
jgi:hypothetical protein